MKRKLKLVSAISMLIFNLFVCFASVFAWFYACKNPGADDIGMMIDANELTLAYELYKYDIEDQQVVSVNTFDFNAYDTIIDRYNIYTAVVLKVTLFSNLFKADEARDVIISSHCTEDDYTSFALSNILFFQTKYVAIDESDIYFNTKNALENEPKHTFFTSTKLTDISYTISVTPTEDNQVVMYSIIDYDKDLVEAMHIDYHNVPTFTNDITYIRYGVVA